MSVEAHKKEILRLIARVSHGSEPGRARAALPQRVASRERELLATRARRRELEEQLLEGKLGDAYREILDRIEALERAVYSGRTAPGASAVSSRPAPEAAVAPEPPLPEGCTLSGEIREGVLADILQMLSANQSTGIVTVVSGSTRLELHYREGEIRHALGDAMSGESAFFSAMAVEQGRFYFQEKAEVSSERTIENKTQFLILEALRQIDEARAEEAGGGPGKADP